MKRSALLLAGILGLGAPLTAATLEEAPAMHLLQEARPDNDRVDTIVENLQSGNSMVRDGAFNELMALDESALGRLKHHLNDEDTPDDIREKLRLAVANLGGEVEPKKSGLVIKAKKADGPVIRISGGEVRISIVKADKTFEFHKADDGSIHVEVIKDDKTLEYDYDSEDELAESELEIHKVYKDVKVEAHGEAAPVDMEGADPGDGPRAGDSQALREFNEKVREYKEGEVQFAEGDLSDEEIDSLMDKARKRLEKDMAEFEEREREAARESDPDDRAEELWEIKFDRYRASLVALERDLLYRVERLREPGGDNYEDELDNLEDKIKDTFADLHDEIDDNEAAVWGNTLNKARKYHVEFGKQVNAWASKIGVNPEIPNARDIVTSRKKTLINRLKRLRKLGGEKYESELDALEERIYSSFENLEEKIEDSPPATWGQHVKDSEKFYLDYDAQLDGWAKQIGVDESLPTPLERLAEMKDELRDAIRDLRRIGGDEYEDVIDEIADKVDDTFANLKDNILDSGRDVHAKILEDASKFHRIYMDTIKMWERKIIGASEKIDREFPENPKERGIVEDYPEKDVELPKGEHMDIVEGVRVSRLLPLPKRQLGLENGLSVNEIVDADDALARAGLEVYDIILKVGDTSVDTRTDLRNAMGAIKKGSEFELTIMRDGVEKTLKATK